MELQILSPSEDGFLKEIRWNNEELKAQIAEKMEEYKGLQFTEETIKEAKADRANLNKLLKAVDDERKRIKKICLDPLNKFEAQVKEVLALIEEPIRMIDSQIKEVENRKKEEKLQAIKEAFAAAGFQAFVKFEMIYDSKWLNSTVTMKKIEEQLQERMNHIGQDVFTIQQLPEFAFEAMEVYKKSLDLSQAIQEGQRLADIQKRKKEYEERELEKAKIAESERVAKEEAAEAARREAAKEKTETPAEMQQEPAKSETPITQTIDFRVTGTLEQFVILRKFLEANNIQYGPVPKEA